MTEAFVQSLPLLDSGDVVIAGAGPAGLCAAVAAAGRALGSFFWNGLGRWAAA